MENTFTFTLSYIKVENCHFEPHRYSNTRNLALVVVDDEGEQVAICSVNPRHYKGDDVLCVKDWSENEGMVDFLVKQGVIKNEYDWFNSEESGFVVINAYKLTQKGKDIFKGI